MPSTPLMLINAYNWQNRGRLDNNYGHKWPEIPKPHKPYLSPIIHRQDNDDFHQKKPIPETCVADSDGVTILDHYTFRALEIAVDWWPHSFEEKSPIKYETSSTIFYDSVSKHGRYYRGYKQGDRRGLIMSYIKYEATVACWNAAKTGIWPLFARRAGSRDVFWWISTVGDG